MIYGFIDESGAPGAVNCEHDYICIAVVLFANLYDADLANEEIARFRETYHLSRDFEFHAARNTLEVQQSFVRFLSSLDFHYHFVALKKTSDPRDGSYETLAKHLFSRLATTFPGAAFSVRLDDNPSLRKEIKRQAKNISLDLRSLKEVHSKNNSLVQLADYVVTMSSRQLRKKKVPPEWKRSQKPNLYKWGPFRSAGTGDAAYCEAVAATIVILGVHVTGVRIQVVRVSSGASSTRPPVSIRRASIDIAARTIVVAGTQETCRANKGGDRADPELADRDD